MKTVLQLLLAAIVINACVRAGESAWSSYQFRDTVEQEARFGSARTTSQLQDRLLQIAEDHGITINEDRLIVTRRGLETVVVLEYTDEIPLIPWVYTHPQIYDVSLQVQPLRPLLDDSK
jgi:hypothetical protein